MRHLALLLLISQSAIVMAAFAEAAGGYSARVTVHGIPVEHRIRFFSAVQPERYCGGPIECGRVTAVMRSVCTRSSPFGEWILEPKIVTYGQVYLAVGHFSHFSKVDGTVRDSATARTHVFEWHVNPSLGAVAALIAEEINPSYATIAGCRHEVRRLAALTNARFLEAIRMSQESEVGQKQAEERILIAGLRRSEASGPNRG
ncbi:MAG: hypothetical protein KY459_00920 [Acidobacteria bacterium]|nr:hypothetical protein [Acidobacteriota bacterium]